MLSSNNENELDKLIRDAEGKYHPTGTPDWEAMQTLLDKHMPVRKTPRRRAAFLLILLLSFLLGSTFYFLKNDDSKSIPLKVPPAITESAQQKLAPAASKPENKPANQTQQTQTPTVQHHSTIQQQPASTHNKKHKLSQYRSKVNSKIKMGIVPADEIDTPQPINQTNITSNDKNNHLLPGSPTAALLPKERDSTDVNKPVEISVLPAKEPSQNKTISEANNAGSNKKKPAAIKRKQSPEITLLYAPELTTIKFSNIDNPGSNYGLLIGYPLSKKFTIQTGVMRSRKNYIADGKDFPDTYSTGNHKLKNAEGYCKMYEIPLNIKSQITNGKKTNFFYTVGVSSYIMTSEFYTYHYTTNYGAYSKDVHYNSQQNYWLSVGTIGLGVEKQISNTVNIAAMPYLKIPFKGMGAGNLKLLSAGINFLLSYSQPSKKY
ncbi:MAG: hypothetical protein ABIN01_09915 [Ferruginibacter sp.]